MTQMTMTPDELGEWSERHCRLMGIGFDNDKQCVDEWCVEFIRLGYQIAEINAATTAMAALTQPVKLNAQLAWINNFIASLRSRNGRRDRLLPLPELGYDAALFRSEIEKRYPGHKWTAPNPIKPKPTRAKVAKPKQETTQTSTEQVDAS